MDAAGESYRSKLTDGPVRGRGAGVNPTNRFDRLSLEVLGEHLDRVAAVEGSLPDGRRVATEVYHDRTRSVLNRVDSPDLSMSWTFNPYRGCEHGCIYCYARPGHEYFSLSCGLDFETKIFAKPDAPKLLRKELSKPSWKGQTISMSGVTDCYQPVEAKLGITRRCLEVFAEFRQSVGIVTKSRLVLRDLDLLKELSGHRAVCVAVSVTTLDNKLASKLEPRAASPSDRLWTIRRLASAGIPVIAMVAPILPAVNDREIPAIVEAVAEAGARSAGYVLLRLPYQIKELYEDWLESHFPDRRTKALNLMRQAHGGRLYDAAWHQRQRGSGPYAEQISRTFKVFAHRYGLGKGFPRLDTASFRRPGDAAQLRLFAGAES